MSTHLFFSHQMDTLAQRFAAELVLAFRSQPNPLMPLVVLVPNNAVKRYLQLKVAEETGITANVQFKTFQTGIGELLLGPDNDNYRLTGMDEFRLLTTLALMRHIRANTPVGKALDALSYMLFDESGQPARNFTGRLWHISGQLSYYLTEYEFHRQDMVAGWLSDPPQLAFDHSDPEISDMEACQRVLYLALFGKGGLRDELESETGHRYLTLPQLAKEARWTGLDETLFVFGMSQVSSFHRNLLFSLGNTVNLKIFQLNICSEFWEDITTDSEDRWRRLKSTETIVNDGGDEELAWDENENMLLKWWGKPGREHIRLFSDLESLASAGEGFKTVWLTPPQPDAGQTVLATLQDQVLHRRQLMPENAIPQDRSLQVFGAPGIFREVETIYNSILFNLREDPSLKQTDIAVLVPDINHYKPAVHAVFRRHPRRLGFNLTDANAGNESLFSQGLLGLLNLVEGNFSRKQVFELLRNPCLQKGCGVSRDDIQNWVDWCDQLNIFHEFDSPSSNESARFTWQQGLRRLRLGRLMDFSNQPGSSSSGFMGTKPYTDLNADNRAVEGFSLTVEALFRETSRIAELKTGLHDWYAAVERLVDRFLGIPDNHEEEASARDLFLGQLRKHLAFEPLFLESPVGLDYIRELVVSCIEGIPSRHGSYLSGGITISAIKANRPIPFKIVYIAGLGEGQFPGQADLSSLNLRNAARKLGDISRPEEEKFSVLETIMGCKHKLYLSYVSKDLQKDQDFYPSSIIVQLLSYIEQFITNAPFETADVPVDSADERFLNPASANGCFDLFVNYSDYDRLLCLESLLSLSPERLGNTDLPQVQAWLDKRDCPGSIKKEESAEQGLEIDHRSLRDYLDNPLESSLKHRLKIFQYGDDEPDKTLVEDEPFFSTAAISRAIVGSTLQGVVQEVLDSSVVPDHQQVKQIFEDTYEHYFYNSSTPEGVFGAVDKVGLLDKTLERYIGGRGRPGLASCLQNLSSADPVGVVSVGGGMAEAGLNLEPYIVPLADGAQAELSTTITNLWYDATSKTAHQVFLSNGKGDHREFPMSSTLLSPFLGYLIALASQGGESCWWRDVTRFVIHWSSANGFSSTAYSVTPDTAGDYLSLACHDFQTRPFDMLPYSVLYSLTTKRTELPIPFRPGSQADAADKGRYARRLEREVLDLINNKWSSWYSSRLLKLLDYSVPHDAWDVSNRRFTLFHAGARC